MCLVLFALDSDPRYRLVVAANRDEYHRRPTAPAGPWPDNSAIFGGRDLERGGSWCALHADGRLALVTNVRQPDRPLRSPRSRGVLVSEFLAGRQDAAAYLKQLAPQADHWQGFNLVLGRGDDLYYWSNRGTDFRRLDAGCYGLSNALLDAPWPKVRRGRYGLARALAEAPDENSLVHRLFELLADRQAPPDGELPDTGVGVNLERLLSPLFICSAEYGTRASTVLLQDRQGGGLLVERRFDAAGAVGGETWHRCPPSGPAISA